MARQDTYEWILHLGDIGYADDYYLYESNYEQVYSEFMNNIENISSNRPWMVLPGNHEATCNEFRPRDCPNYLKNFTSYRYRWYMPNNESNGIENMWYSFDYGTIHFIQIDTETDFPGAPEGMGSRLRSGPFGDQLTWLTNDLDEAYSNRENVPWIIVSGHRPIWYSAGQNPYIQSTFLPLLTKYKVDFYFAGHEHNYERYYPISSTGSACSYGYANSECPIYIVNGAGGNAEGHQEAHGNPNYLACRDDNSYGWSRLTLHNLTTLQWEFITENNTIIDSIFITKGQ